MRDVPKAKLNASSLVWLLAAVLGVAGWLALWQQISLARAIRQADAALLQGDFKSAQERYQQALSANPRSVRALRGLARVDTSAAVDYLEQALRLSPSSLLVEYELARAYEDNGQFVHADSLWSNLGVDNARALELANAHFIAASYADAAQWFELFLRREPSADKALRFQAVVAAIVSGRRVPSKAEDVVRAYSLDQALLITGGEFRWVRADPEWQLDYGTPLANYPQPPDLQGVLWWNGPAVAVVDVHRAGKYHLSVRARNGARESTAGIPADMWLEHNLQPVATFTLAANDQTWHEHSVVVDLEPGLHLVGVRCLRIEPDPAIDWMKLEAFS